jgi:hypothetical protein
MIKVTDFKHTNLICYVSSKIFTFEVSALYYGPLMSYVRREIQIYSVCFPVPMLHLDNIAAIRNHHTKRESDVNC